VAALVLNGRILKRKTFGLGQIRLLNILTPVFRAMFMDSTSPAFPYRHSEERLIRVGPSSAIQTLRGSKIADRKTNESRQRAPRQRLPVLTEMKTVFAFTKYEKLLSSFLHSRCSLAILGVRGDGVGYYLLRSLLIEPAGTSRKDWSTANESLSTCRTDTRSGQVLRQGYQ